jgi:hypothetical protein
MSDAVEDVVDELNQHGREERPDQDNDRQGIEPFEVVFGDDVE